MGGKHTLPPGFRTIRLDLEYDGESFYGWQRQAVSPTIQSVLEESLARVHGRPITVYGSSRTDSGVHAQGQVAHFYTDYPVPGGKWRDIINSMLPRTIRIVRALEAASSFHSQKDALSKIYEYRVLNRNYASALDRKVYYFPRPLDWKRIAEALPHFVGTKDFIAFQGAKAEVRTTVRTITSFTLRTEYDGLYCLRIEGSGFLKQMVRNVVGTLIEIGEGKRAPDCIPSILDGRSRQKAGKTAPARGLCLIRIQYPGEETLGSFQ